MSTNEVSTTAEGGDSISRILKNELTQRISRNPNYSLRAFARDLELSPSFLSEVINSRKRLSHRTATKIGQRLAFTEHELSRFLSCVEGVSR